MDSSAVKTHVMKKGSSRLTVLIWPSSNPYRLLLTVTIATWFRILVKQIGTGGGANQHAYEWYEMGFFTRWTSKGGHVLFCFDIPLILRDRLKTLFLPPSITPKLSDLYSPHMLVIDEIIKLFDASVWSLRDIVRATEMVKMPSYATGKSEAANNNLQNRLHTVQYGPNFPLLHDFARHTIHSSESLDVAIDTMSGIISQYEWFSDTGRSYINFDFAISRRTQQHLSFQIQAIRSLRARSKANEARLRNEIDLVSMSQATGQLILTCTRHLIPSHNMIARLWSGSVEPYNMIVLQ